MILATLLASAVLQGPFPLLVPPYDAEGRIDTPVLLKEADYVVAQGVGGIIWPSAGAVEAIAASGGYEASVKALAEHAVKAGYKVPVVAVCSGTNSAAAVARVAAVERIAKETGAKMAILARPNDDAKDQEAMLEHYRAIGRTTTLPVIVQTYNGKSPQPSVENLVRLMKEFPEVYGYVKEESPGLQVNDRMREILSHPETKGVFSGWGGKGWAYQGTQIGTCGVISQRPAYASLFVKIYERMKAGADSSDPELEDAYTKYLLMANLGDVFSSWGDDEMGGPHLYVLQRLGVFTHRYVLEAPGKVKEYEMSEGERREIEARMKYVFGK